MRMKYYRQMDSLMMNDAPVVILYYDRVLRFVQNNVEGMENNSMNLLTLKRVRKNNINHERIQKSIDNCR